jgi:hypothetical protein
MPRTEGEVATNAALAIYVPDGNGSPLGDYRLLIRVFEPARAKIWPLPHLTPNAGFGERPHLERE